MNIPNVKITFYNIRSLSAYRKDKTGKNRYKKVISNITSLLQNSHILCLQEVHLLPLDDFSLRKEFKDYLFYYNNSESGSAGGTLIMIHPSVNKFYDISPIPLDSCVKGRVQALRFDPPVGSIRNDQPFNLINWHLEGDKYSQLNSLLNINNAVRTIGGGDCNFVTSIEDAPSDESSILITGALMKVWESVSKHFNFSEIFQPTHTHYFIPNSLDLEKARTSRIDRVYISLDESDPFIFRPYAFIPHLNYNILRRYKSATQSSPNQDYFSDWVTDHLPVSVHLLKNKKAHFSKRQAPRWVADEKVFVDSVNTKLKDYDSMTDDPFAAFHDFCSLIETETEAFINSGKEKKKKEKSEIDSLHLCIRALQLISTSNPDIPKIRKMIDTHLFLKKFSGISLWSSPSQKISLVFHSGISSKNSLVLPISGISLRSHINSLIIRDCCHAPAADTDFNAFVNNFLDKPPPLHKR
jgi:hypothetical protein